VAKILIADDERAICAAFSELLLLEGHTPLVAATGDEALALVEREHPRLVFLDLRMPGMSGLEVLRELNARQPELPVVLMTAYGTVDTAMEAMRLKAFDYLGKPVELKQLRKLLARALHRPQTPAESAAPAATTPAEELIGRSAAMQEIFKLMSLLTSNDLTVLVCGESGAGKELVARGIHRHGPRQSRPFVAVNCAAIPETLMESELFGHEKGAFTDARHARRTLRGGRHALSRRDRRAAARRAGRVAAHPPERSFRVGSLAPRPLRARVAATNRGSKPKSGGRFREDPITASIWWRCIPAAAQAQGRHRPRSPLAHVNVGSANRCAASSPDCSNVSAERDWPGLACSRTSSSAALTARGPPHRTRSRAEARRRGRRRRRRRSTTRSRRANGARLSRRRRRTIRSSRSSWTRRARVRRRALHAAATGRAARPDRAQPRRCAGMAGDRKCHVIAPCAILSSAGRACRP
jgi:CheY-like chemotaxis protein